MRSEYFDVLVVGAGLSGISAGYHLQTYCPSKSYAILEGRETIGGTWDLFRYPGIRSDSDMYTLGYRFQPWENPQAIADGPAILEYIRHTAVVHGIDQNIRFNHWVQEARWSSTTALWEVDVQTSSGVQQFTCNFLYLCSGYYDYEQGHAPSWPGMADFSGRIIHPQQWPEDLDYSDQRVVVIGSGATAVTLVPAMSDRAQHVTMLQRSPTYIVSRPSQDRIANWLRRTFPTAVAHALARWKNILESIYTYNLAQHLPDTVKKSIMEMAQEELGPDFDVETHLNPAYKPWDQRLCLVPDADLFQAIKAGRASIITDHIERFTPTGLHLRSGQDLPADIIVTATGLRIQLVGGIHLVIDGEPFDLSHAVTYRGTMFNDVPNLASAFGYTNASWTLKCELISQYVCRLLNYMDKHGYTQCAPRLNEPSLTKTSAIPLASGYIQRVQAALPKQGNKRPWRIYQNYIKDIFNFRYSRLNDGIMAYSRSPETQGEVIHG